MRPLRPLFHRHASADALEREAENLKNRDWVELLKVVHPSQAADAEREYILSRLSQDWAELTSALLATHSLPTALDRGNLLVLCDHNTFANELSLIAAVVEKKIQSQYNITLRIHARASKRMDWRKNERTPAPAKAPQPETKPPENLILKELIEKIQGLE
jgi:hypothetical protein